MILLVKFASWFVPILKLMKTVLIQQLNKYSSQVTKKKPLNVWVYNEIFFMSNIFRDAAGIMRYHAAYSAADDTRQIWSVGLLTNSLTAKFGPNFS